MSWIILISSVLNLFLGVVVWLRKPKEKLNYLFAIFSISTVASILVDYIFRFYPTVLVLKTSYAFAALVPLTALLWILEICKIRFNLIPIWTRCIIFLTTIGVIGICYSDGLVVQKVLYLTILGYKGELGSFFGLYSLYFLAYACILIYLLYNAQRKREGIEKLQIRFILFGISSYAIVAVFCSVILPTYFDIFDFTLLDAPSLIFFVGFTAYAILRLHFLNIKVIATEMLVFTLSIFIFVRSILSVNLEDIITNWVLFILVIITGIFLIKSVINEISQRERIELLAADLEKANARLTELDRQKSEFVLFATHQLRGPLTAMKGYASLLIEGDMGELPKAARQGVERIFDSTNTLVSIVNDYLNISRIELGAMKYAFQTIDLKSIIEDVVAELKPNIDKTGLKFSFTAESNTGDYRVTADRDKLKQVFANIIDNSLKYTPAGSITASLFRDKTKNLFVFKIADTGVGISAETLPHLFQKFSRAENASKANIRGTGLGLYVAKQMIEAHHGTIRAESDGEGKGSTFIVELEPFAKG